MPNDKIECWCCQSGACQCEIVQAEVTTPYGFMKHKPYCTIHHRVLMHDGDDGLDADEVLAEMGLLDPFANGDDDNTRSDA